MHEHKVIYKRCFIILIIILAVYGAYTGGLKHKENINSNYEALNSGEIMPADNITFNNSDGDSSNTEKDNSDNKDITYEDFLNIKIGASYDDIKSSIGEGKEISSTEISGVKTTMYEWDGKGISNITLTLQDGKLISKTQLGLKSMDAHITLDKYNMINNGMSYDNVKEILGEGQLITESSMMNNTSYIYSYINKDGSNANFTFDSNGMTIKAQYNLK
ncbi:MAG: DUF3862 domain-containing protein [Clostridium sp.]|nr:DUF3862 domain-containing protein [Clostridium sp.]